MITLIVEANRIPNGTRVRKVSGQNTYIVNHSLKIYVPGDSREIKTDGIVYLTSENSINGIPNTTKLAIDIDEADAIEFIRGLIGR